MPFAAGLKTRRLPLTFPQPANSAGITKKGAGPSLRWHRYIAFSTSFLYRSYSYYNAPFEKRRLPRASRPGVSRSMPGVSRKMNLRSLFSMFSSDLAIDLGTANTLVYVKDKGMAVNEPSIVAINKITREVEAGGREGEGMLGGTTRDMKGTYPH